MCLSACAACQQRTRLRTKIVDVLLEWTAFQTMLRMRALSLLLTVHLGAAALERACHSEETLRTQTKALQVR